MADSLAEEVPPIKDLARLKEEVLKELNLPDYHAKLPTEYYKDIVRAIDKTLEKIPDIVNSVSYRKGWKDCENKMNAEKKELIEIGHKKFLAIQELEKELAELREKIEGFQGEREELGRRLADAIQGKADWVNEHLNEWENVKTQARKEERERLRKDIEKLPITEMITDEDDTNTSKHRVKNKDGFLDDWIVEQIDREKVLEILGDNAKPRKEKSKEA